MSKLLLCVIIGGLLLYGYQRAQPTTPLPIGEPYQDQQVERETPARAASDKSQFRCNGRKHCSQMSSCEEATFFLENCPGTKMDGDRDGIPCEEQHCRN